MSDSPVIKATIECVKVEKVIGPDDREHFARLAQGVIHIDGKEKDNPDLHVDFAYRVDTNEEWDSLVMALIKGEEPEVEFTASEIVAMRVHVEAPGIMEQLMGGGGAIRHLTIPEGPPGDV